jgi:hypothetical protein
VFHFFKYLVKILFTYSVTRLAKEEFLLNFKMNFELYFVEIQVIGFFQCFVMDDLPSLVEKNKIDNSN